MSLKKKYFTLQSLSTSWMKGYALLSFEANAMSRVETDLVTSALEVPHLTENNFETCLGYISMRLRFFYHMHEFI